MIIVRILTWMGTVSWTFLAGAMVTLNRPLTSSLLWVFFFLGVVSFFVAAWMWATVSANPNHSKTQWGPPVSWVESFEKLRVFGGTEVVWESSHQKLLSFSSLSRLKVAGLKEGNSGWVANHSETPLELCFADGKKSVVVMPSQILRFSWNSQPSEVFEIRTEGARVYGLVCFQKLQDRLDL